MPEVLLSPGYIHAARDLQWGYSGFAIPSKDKKDFQSALTRGGIANSPDGKVPSSLIWFRDGKSRTA